LSCKRQIFVRGTTICSGGVGGSSKEADAGEEQWTATDAMGSLRTNGTLVVLLPASAAGGSEGESKRSS
jgi:hypothetical protein